LLQGQLTLPISRAELKSVRSLQTKKGRRVNRQFAVDGVRTLEEAFRHGALPLKLYFAQAILSDRGAALVERFQAKSVSAVTASANDLARMSGAVTSPGIMAIFAVPCTNLAELYRRSMRNILVCENLSDPGNVGTLCRSAAAFGFDLVVLCGKCAEPYAPKVVRSSVGAVFGVPVATASSAEMLDFFAGKDFAIVAADAGSGETVSDVLTNLGERRMLLAVGSEATGLSADLSDGADFSVRIGHEPKVESLNTAVAGSILMNECYNRRLRRP
jgi:TrmH family RNA methyltransferase